MGRLGVLEVSSFARGGIAEATGDAVLHPFGRRTAMDATKLPPGWAAMASNCQVRGGVVAPLYGPGAALTGASVPSGAARSVYYLGDGASGRWTTDSNDAGGIIFDNGDNNALAYISYDGSPPKAHSSKDGYLRPLGILAPTVAPTGGGAAATARYYRYTYLLTATNYGVDVESNPSPAASLATANVIATCPPAGDDVGANFRIRVYATAPGLGTPDPQGPYFFVDEASAGGVSPGTKNFVGIGSTAVNQQRPLYWDQAGAPGNAFYTEDHSPPSLGGAIQRLADALLVNGTPSGQGSGLALASVGSTLLVSLANGVHYWPTAAERNLDDFIEAIRVKDGVAFVLTRGSVYRVFGTDPYTLDLQRIPDLPAILPDSANAARWCPDGLLYPSKDGVILLAPSGAAINLTRDTMHKSLWQDKDDLSAIYEGGTYTVFDPDAAAAVLVDLREGPGAASVSQVGFGAIAMPTACLRIPRDTSAAAGGAKRGSFVYSSAGGLRVYRPTEEDGVSGAAPLTWTWITPPMGAGVMGPKRWFRISLEGGAHGADNPFDFIVQAKAYDSNGRAVKASGSIYVGGTAKPWRVMLPAGMVGDYLELTIIGQAKATLRGFRVEYEVPGAR